MGVAGINWYDSNYSNRQRLMAITMQRSDASDDLTLKVEADTDAQIIGQSRDSPDEFAALFDRHAPAIHRYIAARIGTSDAEDLMAETFLIAFEKRHRYDQKYSDARCWLFGIATNLVRRRRRSELRFHRAIARTSLELDGEDLADGVAAKVDAARWSGAMSAVIADLSTGDRDVLLLFAWAELGYADIAVALDIPVGTVRSRLNRARKKLRSNSVLNSSYGIESGE